MGGYPAKTATGSDSLRERIETDYSALIVDREVARDKRIEEWISGGLLWFGGIFFRVIWLSIVSTPILVGNGRLISRRILEIPVWVIFDDDHVKFNTNGVNGFAALNAEGSRCGILTDSGLRVSSVLIEYDR